MRERDSGSATAGFLPRPRLPPPGFATADITVTAPPDVAQPARTSPMARLVPVVMAAATVGMVAVVFLSRSGMARNPMFVAFPLLMLVSAVMSAVTGRGRRRAEIDADRADYLGYLSELRFAITKTAAAQRVSLVWCHPEPDALWTLVGGSRMWERRSADSDFCHVRVGPERSGLPPGWWPLGSDRWAGWTRSPRQRCAGFFKPIRRSRKYPSRSRCAACLP